MTLAIAGKKKVAAPRERVWSCLTDPAFLKAAIPGCESVTIESDGSYLMRIGVHAGPLAATVKGRVRIDDPEPPLRYILRVSGSAPLIGSVAGHACVTLAGKGDRTLLAYEGEAEIRGMIAGLGHAVIEGTTQKLTDRFFAKLRRLIEQSEAEPATPTLAAVDHD